MGCYSAIKRNEGQSDATTFVNLENIILSEGDSKMAARGRKQKASLL
jgi:hypothetical protein